MLKKAQSWGMSLTAKIILALVFTVVGLILIRELSSAMVIGYDKQNCKMSVIYNSKFRIPIIKKEEFNINCPTRYITITPEKIVVEIEGRKFEEKIKCGNLKDDKEKKCFLRKVNSQIASLIFDCWDQFAAGQLPVFSRYDAKRQCIICSRVEFDQNVKNLFGSSAEQETTFIFLPEADEKGYPLDNYMRSHNPPIHEITYYEFSLDKTDAFKPPYYDYNMDKPMAAVFVVLNQPQVEYLTKEAWEKVKSIFVEPKTENKYEYVNTLEWVPYEEIEKKCDVLV